MPFSPDSVGDLLTPDSRKVEVNDLVNVYKEINKYPKVNQAIIDLIKPNVWGVTVFSDITNCDIMEIETYQQSVSIIKSGNSLNVQQVSLHQTNSNVLAQDTVGKNTVHLKKFEDKRTNQEDFAITWIRDGLFEKSIKLSNLDGHGPVIIKPPFFAFSLSHDGSSVLYVAEKKHPKSRSYFSKSNSKDEKENQPGNEYVYKEDWGEELASVRSTVVCVLNLSTEHLRVVELPDLSLATPFWIANSNKQVGFIGFNEQPRRLGIIYCTNRQSSLFKVDLNKEDAKPVCLIGESEVLSLRSPRISPNGDEIILLENSIHGPHHKASDVVIYHLKDDSKRTIIDTSASLYLDSFPTNCWHPDGTTIYFNSNFRGCSVLWMLNVKTKSLTKIATPLPSSSILSYKDGLALVLNCSVNQVPQLFATEISEPSSFGKTWVSVTGEFKSNQVAYSIDEVGKDVQTFLISPVHLVDKPGACIVSPHGGPHFSDTDIFTADLDRFTKLGFKVMFINYSGSSGVDEDFLNSLPGNVGSLDVDDCISAIDHYVEKGLVDEEKLLLYGASHGGFLVCHLSAHSKYNWVAAGAVNPVVDVLALYSVTDIPDWSWTEALGTNYEFDSELDSDTVVEMYKVSPFSSIAKVATPTLMLLGTDDRRCPMSQGLRWIDYLKASGVETRCLVYNDNHDLKKPEVDSDVFVNVMLWFLYHLNDK